MFSDFTLPCLLCHDLCEGYKVDDERSQGRGPGRSFDVGRVTVLGGWKTS